MKCHTSTVRSIAILTTVLTGLFAALFVRSVTPRGARRRSENPSRWRARQ
ncbi:hypothetical protein [Sulfitobacter pontiacus]